LQQAFPVGQAGDAVGAVDVEAVRGNEHMLALDGVQQVGKRQAGVVGNARSLGDGDRGRQLSADGIHAAIEKSRHDRAP
jgi:hypothetical protein